MKAGRESGDPELADNALPPSEESTHYKSVQSDFYNASLDALLAATVLGLKTSRRAAQLGVKSFTSGPSAAWNVGRTIVGSGTPKEIDTQEPETPPEQ